MLGKDIVLIACKMLKLADVENELTQNSLQGLSEDAKIMTECLNLTLKEISEEYVPLKKIEKFETVNGLVAFDNFYYMPIKIFACRNLNGQNIDYSVVSDGILTKEKDIEIEYSHSHQDVGLATSIDASLCLLSPRIVAYGVVSEYYLWQGVYELASLFSKRFVSGMRNLNFKQSEIIMKKPVWI